MAVLGILFLIIFISIILFLRNKINTGNNPYLKTVLKIGDIYTWFRFIGGIFVVLLFIFFLTILGKKH